MRDLRTSRTKLHNLFYSSLDTNLQKQLKFITNYLRAYTKRAYIVGGAIRDHINNTNIYDMDIEIYDIDAKKFDSLMRTIGAKNVGKSFFVYKYKDLDLALARSEKQISNHHRGFEVSIETDEIKACIRRDFAMNSIMLNIFNYKLLDTFNGIEDIKNKKVSIIDSNRFKEDSLRVLRAMQFCARFGFRCDKKSIHIMQNMDISNISKSRIFVELEKLFLAPHLHIGWFYFVKLSILQRIFNINCTFEQFIKIYKILKNNNIKQNQDYKFYFLYIIFCIIKPNRIKFFKTNIFPNTYKKNLINQKYIPKNPTDKFLIALSLKHPLKQWLGCYNKDIKQRSKKLNIYENSFSPKHSISDIINMGYKNKDIKIMFNKLAYKEIRSI